MELLVFWLIPVLLLIVLIFLTISITNSLRLKKLIVIEPVGSVIKDWLIIRSEPAEASVLLQSISSAFIEDEATISTILAQALKRNISSENKAKLLPVEELSLSGVLSASIDSSESKNSRTILVGLVSTIKPFLTKNELLTTHVKLLSDSANNGFLALAVAERVNHHSTKRKNSFRLVGTIIIEPIFADDLINKLNRLEIRSLKILTELPDQLAVQIFNKLNDKNTVKSVSATTLKEVRQIKYAEAELEEVDILSEANHEQKHFALRTWQRQHQVIFLSKSEEDQSLPAVTKVL